MKKIMTFLTGVLSLFLLSSCTDFLTVNPSNQAEASTTMNNERDAKVMIDGLMRNMTSSSYYGRNMVLYGDARGGDYAVISLGRSGGLDQMYTFAHSATANSFSGFWTQIYYCMLLVNNILENITKIEANGATTAGMTAIKGQALTLRALMHFDLVRLYGYPYTKDNGASLGIPIVTSILDVYATPHRSTVAEVYTQILSDLAEGATMLSD